MMTPPLPFCLCPPNPVYKDPLPPLSVVRLQDRFPVYPPPLLCETWTRELGRGRHSAHADSSSVQFKGEVWELSL